MLQSILTCQPPSQSAIGGISLILWKSAIAESDNRTLWNQEIIAMLAKIFYAGIGSYG
jgi:hypothetical protein